MKRSNQELRCRNEIKRNPVIENDWLNRKEFFLFRFCGIQIGVTATALRRKENHWKLFLSQITVTFFLCLFFFIISSRSDVIQAKIVFFFFFLVSLVVILFIVLYLPATRISILVCHLLSIFQKEKKKNKSTEYLAQKRFHHSTVKRRHFKVMHITFNAQSVRCLNDCFISLLFVSFRLDNGTCKRNLRMTEKIEEGWKSEASHRILFICTFHFARHDSHG